MKKKSTTFPQHVAFIMDGNRRYAKKHKLNPLHGHNAGVDRIEPLIDRAIERGIPYLSFWAFSTENWGRNKTEVQFLLTLFRKQLETKISNFHKKNVKLNIIGNLTAFPDDIQKRTQEWMKTTKDNTAITVNVALSYGGRDEILRAAQKCQISKVKGQNITAEQFSRFLDTAGQPDPDLLIRTGGEMRLSGFMLWQIEYTELYFTETLWPAFTPESFDSALEEYHQRQRRFGK